MTYDICLYLQRITLFYHLCKTITEAFQCKEIPKDVLLYYKTAFWKTVSPTDPLAYAIAIYPVLKITGITKFFERFLPNDSLDYNASIMTI